MTKTTFINPNEQSPRWFVIDCEGHSLGRLASFIANFIRGKDEASYFPGNKKNVTFILVNTGALKINPSTVITTVHAPGRPGSCLKTKIGGQPTDMIRNACYNMIPSSFSKSDLRKRLKVYKGSYHPHQAQSPIKIPTELIKNFYKRNSVSDL